jgi:TolB-like protein/DNA-binding SARP family transcriptional activator
MMNLKLFFTGPLRIERDGETIMPPASRKTRAILGMLALSGRPVSRQRLCDLFFDIPDDPRAALRWSLTKLRPLVDEPAQARIVAQRDSVTFNPVDAEVDVLRVLQMAAAPMDLVSDFDLETVLNGITGEVLEDAELPDLAEYSAWLTATRQDLRAAQLVILNELQSRAKDQPDLLVRVLRRNIEIDPLAEDAYIESAKAHLSLNQPNEASNILAIGRRAYEQAGIRVPHNLIQLPKLQEPPRLEHPRAESVEQSRVGKNQDGRLKVAVIPFWNHITDQLAEKDLDRLLESIIHSLSSFSEFNIVGLSQSLQFKGQGLTDTSVMAASLNADFLLGGSVRHEEDRFVAKIRIVEAKTAALIASGEARAQFFDHGAPTTTLSDQIAILASQHFNKVARGLATQKPEQDRLPWEHIQAGIKAQYFDTPIDYERANACFETALAIEPEMPIALAMSASVKPNLMQFATVEGRQLALDQAYAAMARGSSDGRALAMAGWAATQLALDFDAGLRAIQRATIINPLSLVTWTASAWVHGMNGDYAIAQEHWNLAEACNPQQANIDTIWAGRAICYWLAGQYEKAAIWAKRTLEHAPTFPVGLMVGLASAASLKRDEDIKLSAERLLKVFPMGLDHPALSSVPIRSSEARTRFYHAVAEGLIVAGPQVVKARSRLERPDLASRDWIRERPVEPKRRPGPPSIAVLPFKDFSEEPIPAWASDGLSEGVTHALSRFRTLIVIARASAKQYGDALTDPKVIGEALGADLLVGTTLIRQGDDLRVKWHLISAKNGQILASNDSQGNLKDVWGMQEAITAQIVSHIEPAAQENAFKQAQSRPTHSHNAYDLYLQGLFAAFGVDRTDYATGLKFFNAALELDPHFLPAAGMAPWAAAYGNLIKSQEDQKHYGDMARGAVRRSGGDARTLAMAGTAVFYLQHDYGFGERAVERAIQTNANEYVAWICGGWISVQLGKHQEAMDRFAQAERLNPLAFGQDGIHSGRALSFFLKDELEIAEHHVTLALETQALNPSALATGVAIAALRGDETRLGLRRAQLIRLYPEGLDSMAIKALPFVLSEHREKYFSALRLGGIPG